MYLIWELSDAFYKVLVGLPVGRYNLTKNWDDLEGVIVVQTEKKQHTNNYD